jgi:hypothetical protein
MVPMKNVRDAPEFTYKCRVHKARLPFIARLLARSKENHLNSIMVRVDQSGFWHGRKAE